MTRDITSGRGFPQYELRTPSQGTSAALMTSTNTTVGDAGSLFVTIFDGPYDSELLE
jgi:hypothetical protein